MSTVTVPVGSLCEYMVHECLKSSLAFRGALGRLGYLCAGGAKALFVAAADHSMLLGPSTAPQTIGLLTAALSTIH